MFQDTHSSPLDLRSKARRILETFGWVEGARYIRNHNRHTSTEKAVLLHDLNCFYFERQEAYNAACAA